MADALSPVLLPGETIHPSVGLQHSPELGNFFAALEDVPLGTILVRSRGFPSGDDGSVNLIASIAYAMTTDADEAVRISQLCPSSIETAPAELLIKFENDTLGLEQIRECLKTDYDCSVALDELRLIQVKLDRNMFEPGLYPLACFFNHSCAHNCAGAASVVYAEETEEEIPIFEVRALCRIAKGTPLCINYLPTAAQYAPRVERAQRLQQQFGFECSCELCAAPDPSFMVQLGGEDAEFAALQESAPPCLAAARTERIEISDLEQVYQWLIRLTTVASPTHWLVYRTCEWLQHRARSAAQASLRESSAEKGLALLEMYAVCCTTMLRCCEALFHPSDPSLVSALSICADAFSCRRTAMEDCGHAASSLELQAVIAAAAAYTERMQALMGSQESDASD